jgi:hypothetical protein
MNEITEIQDYEIVDAEIIGRAADQAATQNIFAEYILRKAQNTSIRH